MTTWKAERETSVATKHLHRASTLTSSGLVARRRIPCCLRGRIDSAQAEELLAGLGYTVDSSGEQAHHRRRRRRYANKADENQTPHQQNRADENDDGPIEGGLDPQVRFKPKGLQIISIMSSKCWCWTSAWCRTGTKALPMCEHTVFLLNGNTDCLCRSIAGPHSFVVSTR